MKTINQYIELAKEFITQSNENLLKFHRLLQGIKEEKLWQKKDFYKNQNIFDHKEYSKMAFDSFIKKVFGITSRKFEAIERILSLDKGKDLFLKYGKTNLSIYYHSTDEERIAILNEVKAKNRLSPWSTIKRELFPNIKPKKETLLITDGWKKKYEAEKKAHDITKKRLKHYEEMVNAFTKGIKKAA